MGFLLFYDLNSNTKRGATWDWMAYLLLATRWILGGNFNLVEWHGHEMGVLEEISWDLINMHGLDVRLHYSF